MKILGIDPGSLNTGYGVINFSNHNFELITAGRITNNSSHCLTERFNRIYSKITEIIAETQPEVMAIENVIYCNNTKIAIKLGEARGVAILAASQSNIPIAEYSPKRIKQAVVGNGNASKQQVQGMITHILGISSTLSPDAADALAAAICYINDNKLHPVRGRHAKDAATTALRQSASNGVKMARI